MTTPNLLLTEMLAAQVRPDLVWNDALRKLDGVCQLAVTSTYNSPPGGAIADGECFIVGVAPGGAWTGHANAIAIYDLAALAWRFVSPQNGWLAYMRSASPPRFWCYVNDQWNDTTLGLEIADNPLTRPESSLVISEDFLRGVNESLSKCLAQWHGYNSDLNATVSALAGTAGDPGAVVLTSINTNSIASLGHGIRYDAPTATYTPILLSGGATTFIARVKVPTLPDGTVSFDLLVGMINGISSATPTGLYFTINASTGVWSYIAKGAGTTTVVDAGSLAVSTSWQTLKIEVDASATYAKFYIDGSLRTTIVTNLPTTGMTLGARFKKTLGAPTRTAHIGFMRLQQILTTARWT
jgi:hypothetical protein